MDGLAYTAPMRTLGFLILAGCTTTGGECPRVDDWREPIVMDADTISVDITGDCAGEIEITEASLSGPGFEADLPEIGDIVDAQNFAVDVSFVAVSPGDGEYQATLQVSGVGLVDMPPRDVIYVVGSGGSDTGLD